MSFSTDNQLDAKFFDRASAVVNLMNEQIKDADRQLVGASLMLASARFNSWVSAVENGSADRMKADRDAYIDAMTQYYRGLLEDQYDEYVANYEPYLSAGSAAGQV
jgi:Protein of unknown function (DUF3144)